MTIVGALVRKHPVVTYFALTFTISWGGVLLLIGGPAGMTGTKAQDNPWFPLALLAMVAGPSISVVLLTGLIDGHRAFREESALGARRAAAGKHGPVSGQMRQELYPLRW